MANTSVVRCGNGHAVTLVPAGGVGPTSCPVCGDRLDRPHPANVDVLAPTTLTPRQFEELVAASYRSRGYVAEVTAYGNDYGVDVFATKGDERLAVQAKMYGGSARRINREMVMQLHGAKDYFDCTRAVVVTDGEVLGSAREVAQKLGIEIVVLPAPPPPSPAPRPTATPGGAATDYAVIAPQRLLATGATLPTFDEIWQRHVMPLAGRTLVAQDGRTNTIVSVDWGGVERVTSSGGRQRIAIEAFRLAVARVFATGWVSRQEINDEYAKRASSGIVLILAQVPCFEHVMHPSGIRLRPGPGLPEQHASDDHRRPTETMPRTSS